MKENGISIENRREQWLSVAKRESGIYRHVAAARVSSIGAAYQRRGMASALASSMAKANDSYY